jgi:mannose-6-phosphate isomerase-like protein (cupin superfamily)
MPVIDASDAVHFNHDDGTQVVGLASPSRGSTELSAWRLRLAVGACSPRHAVDREEVFVILAGRVRLTHDGGTEEACAGGALVAPTGQEFVVHNPGPDDLDAVVCAPAAIMATVDGESFAPPWAA